MPQSAFTGFPCLKFSHYCKPFELFSHLLSSTCFTISSCFIAQAMPSPPLAAVWSVVIHERPGWLDLNCEGAWLGLSVKLWWSHLSCAAVPGWSLFTNWWGRWASRENKRGRNAIPQFCTRPITLNIAVNDDDELYEGEISSWQKYAALPWWQTFC